MTTTVDRPVGATQPALDYGDVVRRHRRADVIFGVVGLSVLFVAMGLLVTLVLDLMIDGVPHLSLDFFTNYASSRASRAGILTAWVGTTLVMIVTVALALPLGIGAGLYLEEYAPKNWVTNIIEINVTNLAGVPSIIFGLLAVGLFVYILGLGESVLVAGMTLALLILPVVIVTTREAVRSIPQDVREGAFALGADKWQTVSLYILPAARPGILTGVIAGMSRAIGETAPLITIGAVGFLAFLPPAPVRAEPPFLSLDWLFSPFTVMPIQMYDWVGRPQDDFHALAAATGVVLLAMTLLMNGLAIFIRFRLRRSMR